tara:strand:+ start:696 stop:983 length:288 start_codon:yes stop_codon:yes gene_type:complete
MGATTFVDEGHGRNANTAYLGACDEANAYNGHQEGYSGDIQTTQGFRMMDNAVKRGENLYDAADRLTDNFDKWGPCGCLTMEKGKRYLFFGWAAC